MPNSPRYGIALLVEGQASGETTANEFLLLMEALKCGKVLSRTTTAPPGSPVNGNLNIIPTGATGAWAGQVGKFGWYYNGYRFVVPQDGDVVRVVDENAHFAYSATEALWYPLTKIWSTTEYWTGEYRESSKVYCKCFTINGTEGSAPTSTPHGITGVITNILSDLESSFDIAGVVVLGTNYVPNFQTAFAAYMDATTGGNINVIVSSTLLGGANYTAKLRLTYTRT